MAGEGGGPWWLVLAVGVVTAMAGAIGKLWSELIAARKETAEARREAIALAESNHHDHTRDLRLVIGWPSSSPVPVALKRDEANTDPSPPLFPRKRR
jgi:hypothetical protein